MLPELPQTDDEYEVLCLVHRRNPGVMGQHACLRDSDRAFLNAPNSRFRQRDVVNGVNGVDGH